MSNKLKGKIAIVFGAGSVGEGWGNGKTSAVACAREGAKVMAVALEKFGGKERAATSWKSTDVL